MGSNILLQSLLPYNLLTLHKSVLAGCQVGGHLQKGGKRGHFTGKGGQKEDIFSLKIIHRKQKSIQISDGTSTGRAAMTIGT